MESYKTYTTSQLADAAAVGPQTLRYYERRGILPEPPRTAGGHRIYRREHLQRLLFVQQAQTLGFDLHEIQHMLALQAGPADQVNESVDRLMVKVQEKLTALESIRASLEALRTTSPEAEQVGEQPLAETFLVEPV